LPAGCARREVEHRADRAAGSAFTWKRGDAAFPRRYDRASLPASSRWLCSSRSAIDGTALMAVSLIKFAVDLRGRGVRQTLLSTPIFTGESAALRLAWRQRLAWVISALNISTARKPGSGAHLINSAPIASRCPQFAESRAPSLGVEACSRSLVRGFSAKSGAPFCFFFPRRVPGGGPPPRGAFFFCFFPPRGFFFFPKKGGGSAITTPRRRSGLENPPRTIGRQPSAAGISPVGVPQGLGSGTAGTRC